MAASGKLLTPKIYDAHEWDTMLGQHRGDCVNRFAFQVDIEHSAIEIQDACLFDSLGKVAKGPIMVQPSERRRAAI